ncbi:hypothetical protein GCM10010353_71180 [Streptomyces chryseus]|nr:hypothetical protein GCM10010353_71180 [Streptomyces chryseus]
MLTFGRSVWLAVRLVCEGIAVATVFFGHKERVERLRGQLQGSPAGRRAQRLASAPPDVRLLWGTLLRGAARLDAGLELSDLEERLVRPLRWLLSDDEIREMGRVFTEETSVRNAATGVVWVVSGVVSDIRVSCRGQCGRRTRGLTRGAGRPLRRRCSGPRTGSEGRTGQPGGGA